MIRRLTTVGLAAFAAAVVAAPGAAAETFGTTTRDQRVPTRHGTLYLEVDHPARADGTIPPGPTILTYFPYAYALGRSGDSSRRCRAATPGRPPTSSGSATRAAAGTTAVAAGSVHEAAV